MRERWGVSSTWGASEKGKKVWLVGLKLRGDYVWCLVIVVIFMGYRGAKRWIGDVLKSSFGVTRDHKEGGQFFWRRGGCYH